VKLGEVAQQKRAFDGNNVPTVPLFDCYVHTGTSCGKRPDVSEWHISDGYQLSIRYGALIGKIAP
jgi:hypothetical protein